MCDSIWQSTLQALYGTLFVENKEAAFSNRNLWRSLGSVLGEFSQKTPFIKPLIYGAENDFIFSIWLWSSFVRSHQNVNSDGIFAGWISLLHFCRNH